MWFRNTIRRRAKKTWKHIWLMSTKNFVHICRCYKKLRTFHEFASKFICFKINIIEHELQDCLIQPYSQKYIQLLHSVHCKKHCSKTLYENPLLIPFMFSRHMWKTLKTPFFIPTLFANLFKCTYHRRFNRAYLVFSSHSTSQSMYIFEARNMQYREMRKLMNIYLDDEFQYPA